MHYNPIIQPLLRAAHERNMQRPFVEKILDAMGAPSNVIEAAGGEGLSDREMEVLRSWPKAWATAKSASASSSAKPVKTHVQRILRKLDAASRTQAVAKARVDADLIPRSIMSQVRCERTG